jgi:hypothetical protein
VNVTRNGIRRYILVFSLAVASAVLTVCEHPAPNEPKLAAEPLLLLEDEPAAVDIAPSTGPVADNSRCFACHMNFEEDGFTLTHARADVGCERCHGPSDAHCNDEDNITPPDIMYPAAKVVPLCTHCHARERLDPVMHEPFLDGTAQEDLPRCTECHGEEHRIGYRTRRWNKVTGELIQDDSVRMLGD